MEKVFMRTPRTDIPQVFLREMGTAGGRVAYFPFDIDRTFWEILDVDHAKLLRNAVAWVTNEPAVVTVVGHGVLDVTVWKQTGSLTVHLVNLTNPMMMKGPIREIIPVTTQTVRLQMSEQRAKRVRLLVANSTPAFRQTGDLLEVTVPSILDHEVVAIDV